jgi:hypothetical protein
MGRACRKYGEIKNHKTFQSVNLKERDHFGDLDVDGILNISQT